MGTIITIGGGEIASNETRRIDQAILDMTKKANPKLLFIPTASSDLVDYTIQVTREFESLGAKVSTLWLIKEHYTPESLKEIILGADAIYVGGGNTKMMMEVWRELGLDALLKQAYLKGTVLSGLSAGSICWYAWGHSDSKSFDAMGASFEWSKVHGMRMIEASHVPHYDDAGRDSFDQMYRDDSLLPGIALDNQVALVCEEGTCTIIKDNPEKKAFLFEATDEGYSKRELEDGESITLGMY